MSASVNAGERTSSWLGSGLLAGGLLLLLLGERVLAADLRVVGSGLGVLLLIGALGLRLSAWLRASGAVRVVEGRLLVAGTFVLAAVLVYAASTAAGLSALGLAGEPGAQGPARAGTVLSVAWVAILLVSAGALLFMELAYARMPVAGAIEPRRVARAAQAGLTLSLSLVLLLSVNYVASERDVRRDVSYFKTTRPGEGSLGMVERLDADLRVLLFFEQASDVLPQVRPYFDALAARSPHLTVEVVDFDLQPKLARDNRIRGNGYVLLLTGEGDAERGKSFEVGTELTAARRKLKTLDATFQEHFAQVMRAERKVYLTSGHDERNAPDHGGDPAEGIKGMQAVLSRLHLKSEKLGIGQGLGDAVPDGSSAVVVFGPRRPFLQAEVDSLVEHVRQGGRLLLMLDPDADTGLSPLLSALGLQLLPGTLASEKQHMRFNHDESDRTIVYSNSYSSHPTVTNAMRNQRDVATVFYRGVALGKLAGERGKDAPKVRFPLRGQGFFRDLDGDYVPGPEEKPETLNLMAAVSLAAPEGREGRAVVIGDGDFMTDRLARNHGNMMVFVDSLAWLIGDEELPATASSEEDVPIQHSRDEDKLWFYATTFAVPLPVLVLGLWNARRRRRRGEAAA